MHVKNIDHYCKLYEVCKEFRNVIYFKRTAFIVHLDALTENSGLKYMPNLKKLTITAMNSFQEIALLCVDLFLEFEFQNLEVLVLKNFLWKTHSFQHLLQLFHMFSYQYCSLCLVMRLLSDN